MLPMLLEHGNLGAYRSWLGKNLAVYQKTALASTKDYSTDWTEVLIAVWHSVVPLLIQLGFDADSAALQTATGLSSWDEGEGFASLWAVTAAGNSLIVQTKGRDMNKTHIPSPHLSHTNPYTTRHPSRRSRRSNRCAS